jgi:isochorismate hydrolase
MKHLKELYFTVENFAQEVSLLQDEIASLPLRGRNWEAAISESALIVTDLQKYFLSPDSHAFIPSAPAIIPNIRMLIHLFRENQRPVIFTRHTNNLSNAGSMNWYWNDLIEEGSRMSLIAEALDPGNDRVLVKHQYDAFYNTDLEGILKSENTRFLVICGVMANLCCETTVRSAFVRGFRPVLPIDATATYHRQIHISTFRNLAFGFSPPLNTEEVCKILTS